MLAAGITTPVFAVLRTLQQHVYINLIFPLRANMLILLPFSPVRFSYVRQLFVMARDLLKRYRRVGVAMV